MGKDLLDTTKPGKVPFTCNGSPFSVLATAYIVENNLSGELHKKAIGTLHGQLTASFCEKCFFTQSIPHWACTLPSKDLLVVAVGSSAKFSRLLFEDPKHATGHHIKKMLIKHNRETKVLDRGWKG